MFADAIVAVAKYLTLKHTEINGVGVPYDMIALKSIPTVSRCPDDVCAAGASSVAINFSSLHSLHARHTRW